MTTASSVYKDDFADFTSLDNPPETGTGNYGTFLTIQSSPLEEGYNRDGGESDFDMDQKRDQFTNPLLLSDLAVVDGHIVIKGDFDEPQGGDKDYLSLLAFEIYLDDDGVSATQGALDFSENGGNPIYQLQDQLDFFAYKGGNGQDDMYVKIDASLFSGYDQSLNFVLYVKMGRNCQEVYVGDKNGKPQYETVCDQNQWPTDSGFEEFAAIYADGKLPPVPLPAAGWLLIAGLGGLAAMKRRKS